MDPSGLRDKIVLTYDNAKCTDGPGSQLQRIYGTYAVSRFLGTSYLHSPLRCVNNQGLAALERNATAADYHERFNELFRIESDVAPTDDFRMVDMDNASMEGIEQLAAEFDAGATGGRPSLVRLGMPYGIADRFPDCYEVCKAISPLAAAAREGRALRVAIHVRRGELLVIASQRMLPNSYYVRVAQNVVRILEELGIEYQLELHTEIAGSEFLVPPGYPGLPGNVASMPISPEMTPMGEFDVLPHLVRCINDPAIDCLRQLATADVLVTSRSSFSYLAGILNRTGVILCYPFWHSSLSAWVTVDPDGQFDPAKFVPALDPLDTTRRPGPRHRKGRPRALFIVPATPAESGNGLAMRAGLHLEALAADCEVSLLIVQAAGAAPAASAAPEEWPRFILDRTVDRASLPLTRRCMETGTDTGETAAGSSRAAALQALLLPAMARLATSENVEEARRLFRGHSMFDIVFVMRLYLAPFLAAFPNRQTTMLDLDDDEVVTRRRLSELHARLGQSALSEAEAAESDKYRVLEAAWLPVVDHVLVCSAHDRDAVASRTAHASVHVVPNGIRPPDLDPAQLNPAQLVPAQDAASADSPVRLLFVGSLGYFPNADAAAVLCREILPELRRRTDRAISVDLVGSRPASVVTELGGIDGVTIHADVAAVSPFYRRADIVVAPIRAGGGTRLKILEAFAHRVPVVSTSAGAEGLRVVAGQHLLVADDVDGIVGACVRLLLDPDLANRLAAEAAALVAGEYDISIVASGVRAMVRDALALSAASRQ